MSEYSYHNQSFRVVQRFPLGGQPERFGEARHLRACIVQTARQYGLSDEQALTLVSRQTLDLPDGSRLELV